MYFFFLTIRISTISNNLENYQTHIEQYGDSAKFTLVPVKQNVEPKGETVNQNVGNAIVQVHPNDSTFEAYKNFRFYLVPILDLIVVRTCSEYLGWTGVCI